ncbi:hypothetical protein LCGC14_2575510 [marine sediment metagenome]|uniref:Uncharacterized protein n=1 Tax=marine sediment metagenome TaxID=412755 RepID=A0A0F9AG11_9ZZZZ
MTGTAGRPGHALVGTMIFLVLGMMLWAAVHQQSSSHLRSETALRVREEQAAPLKSAMAWCLALLTTGDPPGGLGRTYECLMAVDGVEYVAIFNRPSPFNYTIQVRPKVQGQDDLLPTAPETFGG